MARALRIQYPGAIYHVMSRGDRREDIFLDDLDRGCFLDTLSEACAKTGWQLHAYCLMRNHFHLVVETPRANLVDGMKWFLGTYTGRFNRRHKYFGHLFSGRYKALVVDGSGTGYLRTVCEYVHLNPVQAKLLRAEQALSAYGWSSYPSYLHSAEVRPPWLRVDRVLGECGILADTWAGRRHYEQLMEERRGLALGKDYRTIRRGWCFGDEQFREELLAQVEGKLGPNHFGPVRQESGEQKALEILAEERERLGWTPEELRLRGSGDVAKVAIARRLRAQTTMSLEWVAGQLGMSSWKYLSKLLSADGNRRERQSDGTNRNLH
jgi:putative transposase